MTNIRNMSEVDKLRRACAARDAKLELKGEGHFHIRGDRLVNYYPFSRRRTAYVPDETRTVYNVDPDQAVELAFPSC